MVLSAFQTYGSSAKVISSFNFIDSVCIKPF